MAYELHVPRIAELRSDLGIVVAVQLIFLQQHGDTERLILKRANVAGNERQCWKRFILRYSQNYETPWGKFQALRDYAARNEKRERKDARNSKIRFSNFL
jgi:hypothetical protein